MFAIKFDEVHAQNAFDQWGCNCGPAALAAILDMTLDDVRPIVENVAFGTRGYMNVSMMREAIKSAGGIIAGMHIKGSGLPPERFFAIQGLVRIQFGGPWIIDGKPARWAATATHWVASRKLENAHYVFDINGGIDTYSNWQVETLPRIIESIKRADGSWFPTHSWEVIKR